jgi:hypothetical protein
VLEVLIADGLYRDVSRETLTTIAERLSSVGYPSRDSDTGEIVSRTSSNATAARLHEALDAGAPLFNASGEDRDNIRALIAHWIGDDPSVPADAIALLAALED